jgi:ADP-heptose:LPS heptosyltransferase
MSLFTDTIVPASVHASPAVRPRDSRLVPDVRKIAVLRANAIGDFVFGLPALAALRAAYPDAEIVYLGQTWHARFLDGRPGPIDRVIVIPPSHGVNQERPPAPEAELERFFAAMRAEAFDLALQLHGGGANSNPFMLRLGARLTAGTKSSDAPPLDRWIPYVFLQKEYVRWLEVAGLVGAAPLDLDPHLVVTERDRAEADLVVPPDGRPLVVLHPGAGDPRRRWPPVKFAAVGDALAERGARVVVNGVASEREIVDAVLAAMWRPARGICGALSLGGFVGLLSRARLLVGNDSGPLHLAAAVGIPGVGIYWCFNIITGGPATRAHHYPAVSWQLRCPGCDTLYPDESCDCAASFVAGVPVDEVLDQALAFYESADGAHMPSIGSPVTGSTAGLPRAQ